MTTLYIADNTNTQYALITGLTGSYTEYIEPGKTGTWTWIAEKYGFDRKFGSFTPASGGIVSLNGSWIADTGISEPTQSVVQGYTTISNLDQLYDYAALKRVESPAVNLITKFGTELNIGSTSLVVDSSASAVWNYNATTNILTIKSADFASGSVFTRIRTTGTVTSLNGAAVRCQYTDSTGSSTSFTINNITTGSSVWIANDTETTVYFGSNVTTSSVAISIPPGATGTWSWAVELYGNQRQSNTFEPAGNAITVNVKDVIDVGITEENIATVLAYSNINTLDKLYDIVAAYRMTAAGIRMGQIAVRSGPAVDLGDRGLVVNQSASSLITSASNIITIRSNALANGTKFTLITANPPKLIIADTNEVISAALEDGNGNSSVDIKGGSGTFALWKLPVSTPVDDYASGQSLGNVSNGKYRYLHDDAYRLVIRDEITSFRQVLTMEKGIFEIGLYFGDQVQLAQIAEVTQTNQIVTSMAVDLTAIKGIGFNTTTNSLVSITASQNKIIKKLKGIISSIFGLS